MQSGRLVRFRCALALANSAVCCSKYVLLISGQQIQQRAVRPLHHRNLPPLSGVWIRQHLVDILLPVLHRLGPWGQPTQFPQFSTIPHSQARACTTMWDGILISMREAISKEITPSRETRLCTQAIQQSLRDLLDSLGTDDPLERICDPKTTAECVWNLVDKAVRSLGSASFSKPLYVNGGPAGEPADSVPFILHLAQQLLTFLRVAHLPPTTVDVASTTRLCQGSDDSLSISVWLVSHEAEMLQGQLDDEPRSPVCESPNVNEAPPRPSHPRLRHDDSQVDFVAVDSSPNADSQIFTEHQREVRQRQRDENGIYSDLRSSSPTRSAGVNPIAEIGRRFSRAAIDGANDEPSSDGLFPAEDGTQAFQEQEFPSSPPDSHLRGKADPTRGPSVSTDKPLPSPGPLHHHSTKLINGEDEDRISKAVSVNSPQIVSHSHTADQTLTVAETILHLDGQGPSVLQERSGAIEDEDEAQLAEEANVQAATFQSEIQQQYDAGITHDSCADSLASRPPESSRSPTAEPRRTRARSEKEKIEALSEASRPGLNTAEQQSAARDMAPDGKADTTSATRSAENDLPTLDSGSNTGSEPDVIRAISRSPPGNTAYIQVDVPRTSTPQDNYQAAQLDISAPASSYPSTRLSTTASKRKASSSRPTSATSKRMRVPDTMTKRSSRQMKPLDPSTDDDVEEECIVLGKPKTDEEHGSRVMGDGSGSGPRSSSRRRSQLSKQPPSPVAPVQRRRGRPAKASQTTAQSNQSSSLKRSASIVIDEDQPSPLNSKKRKSMQGDCQSPQNGLRRSARGRSSPLSNESGSELAQSGRRGKTRRTTRVIETPSLQAAKPGKAAEGETAESQLAGQPYFRFTPPEPRTPRAKDTPSSSQALSPSSAAQLAQSVTNKLRELFYDVKRLFMGNEEADEQRQELEDACDALGKEVRAAGRRRR